MENAIINESELIALKERAQIVYENRGHQANVIQEAERVMGMYEKELSDLDDEIERMEMLIYGERLSS